MKEKYLIPKKIYLICWVIFIAGVSQMVIGNIKFGISGEQTIAILFSYIALVLILINDIGSYFKK